MKLGMNLLLWTGNVTADHYPLLAKLKAAGFDGVEIPVFGGGPADYKPLRAELDKHGLKCTTVTILTKETNAISPDPGMRRKAADWLKTVVEINHVLGSETVCGPYHSAIGEFSGTGPDRRRKEMVGGRTPRHGRTGETGQSDAGHRVPEPLRVLFTQHGGGLPGNW